MKKSDFKNILLFFIGAFLLAAVYNIFMVTNNLVVGGVSGLAIIFKKLLNITPSTFILIVNIALLIVSYFVLGVKKTIKNSVGTIIYPVFVSLTENLTNIIKVNSENAFIILTFACICYGATQGLIYKSGISSGGTDTIVQIVSKYYKKSLGSLVKYINIFVVIFGGLIFGLSNMIYAIVALYATGIFTDNFVLGVSNNKNIFYSSKKYKEINKLLFEIYKTGATRINPNVKEIPLYMIVVPNYEFEKIRNEIIEIDEDATIIINDCHEALNGTRNKKNIFNN